MCTVKAERTVKYSVKSILCSARTLNMAFLYASFPGAIHSLVIDLHCGEVWQVLQWQTLYTSFNQICRWTLLQETILSKRLEGACLQKEQTILFFYHVYHRLIPQTHGTIHGLQQPLWWKRCKYNGEACFGYVAYWMIWCVPWVCRRSGIRTQLSQEEHTGTPYKQPRVLIFIVRIFNGHKLNRERRI